MVGRLTRAGSKACPAVAGVLRYSSWIGNFPSSTASTAAPQLRWKIAAPLAIEQGSPFGRRKVEARAPGQMKSARLHRLVIVKRGMQPVAPEEIARQDIGISAATDIGGHGGRRIAAFCRQHATFGI